MTHNCVCVLSGVSRWVRLSDNTNIYEIKTKEICYFFLIWLIIESGLLRIIKNCQELHFKIITVVKCQHSCRVIVANVVHDEMFSQNDAPVKVETHSMVTGCDTIVRRIHP